MRNKLQNDWRSFIIFILLIAMLLALFSSRAALSVTMILFIFFCCAHKNIGQQLRKFLTTPLFWSMSLLFLLPLISGLWSFNHPGWLAMARVKLPLLLLPFAFVGIPAYSNRKWELLMLVFIGTVVVATAWSMFHYAINTEAINRSYLMAKTMTTPLDNDHVRFSWLVSVAVVIAGWLAWKKRNEEKWYSWLLVIVMLWLILFLHILAARTGLFSLYLVLLFLTGWLIFRRRNWKPVLAVLSFLIVIPFAAYFLLPSFRNRVHYLRYDFSFSREAKYLPGGTDALRVISLKAGWTMLKENPLIGVGFGDIKPEVDKWYQEKYPSMQEHEKILPSSEWLMFGSGTGWPGLIIFTGILALPFFTPIKNKLIWWLLIGTTGFSLLFDIGLETQFGVFAFSFVVLYCYHWLLTENIQSL